MYRLHTFYREGIAMKNVGILTLAMLIAMFGMAGTTSAQCIDNLADGLGPASDTVEIGETIEYTISLSVPASPPPPSPPNCTLVNVDLYFFPPPLGSPEDHPCDSDPGLGILIDSGLTLVPGAAPFVYTSADNAILSYVAQAGDAGQTVYAHIATYFNTEDNPTGPPLCDEKESAVDVGCPEPCVEITKTVDCEWSKVGDSVTYTICVENCGELFDLTNVVVTDDLLGGSLGFPSTIGPSETVCLDFVYQIQPGDDTGLPGATVVNTASVSAEQFCGDEITPVGDDSDPVVVTLLHPDYTVTKECQSIPAAPGGTADFLVTITNTGDVDLDITTDDAAITPFTLAWDGPAFEQVVSVPVPLVDPPPEVCNTINVMGTIPVEYCNLPNELLRQATDCCPVESPCIDVTKDVDCDISKVGDEVIYTICVTNCSEPPATLYEVTVGDPLLGGFLPFPTELGPGETVCMDFPYVIQPGDSDPLENVVEANGESESGASAPPAFDDALVDLIHPDFTVTKVCLTPEVPSGGEAEFEITIDNTGDCDLDFTTDEPEITPFTLTPTDPALVQVVTRPCEGPGELCNEIFVTATIPPEYCELPNVIVKSADDCCECPGGDHGCTPGFWKNHPDCWCDAYDPTDLVGDVFTVPSPELDDLADDTLMAALKYKGGAEVIGAARNLLRHGVSALLNACSDDVPFPMSVAGVIDAVNTALATLDRDEITAAKNVLAAYNELGCSIDAHCRPIMEYEFITPARGGIDSAEDVSELMEGKEGGEQLPTKAAVSQSSPNPFRDTARIQFQIPTNGAVAIDVYDVSGRHVVSLMDDQKPAGYHEASWDGRNSAGSQVPAGVYFYRVRLEDETLMEKMILVR